MAQSLSPPPLDIWQYFVEELALRALAEHESDRGHSGSVGVDFEVQRNEKNPIEYRIIMRIKLAESGYVPEENPPYSLALTISGYFRFEAGTDEPTMKRMLHVNGTSILYGIARGLVGQATGASVHGQFVLPTVNFIQILEARERAKAESHAPAIESPADGHSE